MKTGGSGHLYRSEKYLKNEDKRINEKTYTWRKQNRTQDQNVYVEKCICLLRLNFHTDTSALPVD